MYVNRKNTSLTANAGELRAVETRELAEITGGSQPLFDGWRGVPHRLIYGCGTMILVDAMFPISR